jgi:hypothetical protein
MQARTEALLGGGLLLVVIGIAALLGGRGNPLSSEDRRASTLLSGPLGARALAEGLGRLGVEVRRFRGGLRQLQADGADRARTAYVLLDPPVPVRGAEVERVMAWAEAGNGAGVVLAGRGAESLMRCFGYALDWRFLDSVEVKGPPLPAVGPWPRVAGVLAAATDTVVSDTTRMEDAAVTRCQVPPVASIDTLLTSATGRVVALRLHRADLDGDAVLLADASLLRNRALRETEAGPFALGLFAGRYRRAIFDEAHQGFAEGGSLGDAALAWSRRSPWGWAMWQVALVGVLALFADGIRFGPPVRMISRRRRSPLEHVRALATALAAARGHDVAIGSIVEGLRRRLMPAGQRPRGDWREWLGPLGQNVRSERAREAVRTLKTLTRPEQSAEGVLLAANAVEDVWEELRP